jgi:hypothetical protein
VIRACAIAIFLLVEILVRLQREEGSIGPAGAFTEPGGLGGLSKWKCRSPRRFEALATPVGTALLWLSTECAQPQSIAPPVGEATVGFARVLVIIFAARRLERRVSSVVMTRDRAAIEMPAASRDPSRIPEL